MKVICFLALWFICTQRCNANVIIGVNGKIDNDEQISNKALTSPAFVINEELENAREKAEKELVTPLPGEAGDHIIIRIEKLGNRGIKPDGVNEEHDLILDENEFENTTIPPLICWEMTCPDCTKQESDIRCFLRSLLTVLVRTVLCLVPMLLLLMACIKIANHKEKKVDLNCGNKDDKTQLIENCEKGT
ncbi:uncharacterized protein LOC123557782 [Mercenaria mercenaria]|uniref:uncharacterized protein LOC123557782 n=1 Tax=Mercenaria mercenaria TaxID=6596 RepID=UPI00234ED95D|nr:uncharacterized protein LOC123557782 [Mercenaria mercenaria]